MPETERINGNNQFATIDLQNHVTKISRYPLPGEEIVACPEWGLSIPGTSVFFVGIDGSRLGVLGVLCVLAVKNPSNVRKIGLSVLRFVVKSGFNHFLKELPNDKNYAGAVERLRQGRNR